MKEKLLDHAERNNNLITSAEAKGLWDVADRLRRAHEYLTAAILREQSIRLEKEQTDKATPALQRRVKDDHQVPHERGGRLL